MQRTTIHPSLLQEMLDSAPNALAKGQAQFFTPDPWAALLAEPLPRWRETLIDLTCGAGALVRNAANANTKALLGCDIDPAWKRYRPARLVHRGSLLDNNPAPEADRHFTQGDITRLYPLLKRVDFRGDLFALNPPFDLHWSREHLGALAGASENAVAAAFAAHDGRTGRDTIDSTIATLCMALDLGSYYAEGYCIANAATVQRLILEPGAPHHALMAHLWAIVTIGGNICSGTAPKPGASTFRTAVLYFAVSHTDGPQLRADVDGIDAARTVLRDMAQRRLTLRTGAELRSYNRTPDTVAKWKAASEELDRLQTQSAKPSSFHLWLDGTGHIATHLSLFDEHTIDASVVGALHSLRGLRPLQLVLKRETRDLLLRCCGLKEPALPWRACPKLIGAVQSAVEEYHCQRAPIVPLPEIQRLGYIDENDTLHCKLDLHSSHGSHKSQPIFQAGTHYPLRTQTITVTRKSSKWNAAGSKEDVEYTGQELAIFLKAAGREYCFMEGRLAQDDSVTLSAFDKDGWTAPADSGADLLAKDAIDHDLQTLVRHFVIPDVPDIAALRPADYQSNLARLTELETLLNAP